MKRGFYFFLTFYLPLACVDLLASDTDTTAKQRWKVPRSSLYYQVHRTTNPFKQAWVIGSVKFEDTGFRFVAYSEIPGCPQSEFKKLYPLNRGFKDIFIPYSEIKRISFGGRIRLEDGTKHRVTGIHRKEWRAIYEEIKARAEKSRANTRK